MIIRGEDLPDFLKYDFGNMDLGLLKQQIKQQQAPLVAAIACHEDRGRTSTGSEFPVPVCSDSCIKREGIACMHVALHASH